MAQGGVTGVRGRANHKTRKPANLRTGILAPATRRGGAAMTSETIDRLIQQFRTNRTRFNAFCFSLSDEELERPVPNSTYRVKDFVSHLGTLDTVFIEQFRSFASGNPETLGENADGTPFDVDKFNDAEVVK